MPSPLRQNPPAACLAALLASSGAASGAGPAVASRRIDNSAIGHPGFREHKST
jgi:hypothetical protein